MTSAHDLPACGCPGSGPVHGVAAYAVHPHGVTCQACGHTFRTAWWLVDRHLCARCFRAESDALQDSDLFPVDVPADARDTAVDPFGPWGAP